MDAMTTKEVRKMLVAALGQGLGLTRAADGTWTVKREYFYRHGATAEQLACRVQSIDHRINIVNRGDHFATWPKTSYLWVKFTCPFEKNEPRHVNVQVDYASLFASVKASVRQNEKSAIKKIRAYVFEKGETLVENLQRRRCRPVDVYRAALAAGLKQLATGDATSRVPLGLDAKYAETAYWSQKAGCSCGCSPGFILEKRDDFEVFIEVEWNQEKVTEFLTRHEVTGTHHE